MIRIKNGHNAAIKGFKTGCFKAAEDISSRETAIITELFNRTASGIIKGFYLVDSETFKAYHRSTKEAGKIQLSSGYYKNGKLYPTSDAQFTTAADAIRYGVTSGNYAIIA